MRTDSVAEVDLLRCTPAAIAWLNSWARATGEWDDASEDRVGPFLIGPCPACCTADLRPAIASIYPSAAPECFEGHNIYEMARATGMAVSFPWDPPLSSSEPEIESAIVQPPALHEQDDPFRILSAADLLNLPPMSWTVADTIPEVGIGQIVGPSYVGKSYVALDLALSVCNAGVSTWMGRTIERHGPVVYVLAEGESDFGERAQAWLDGHPGSSLDGFYTVTGTVDLSDAMAMATLRDRLARLPVDPALVIVDTQAMSIGDADENSNRDMNRVFRSLKYLRTELSCAVLTVHHTGHDSSKGARGASSQFAACDVSISVGPGALNATKVKARVPWDQPASFEFVGARGMPTYVRHVERTPIARAIDRQTDLRRQIFEVVSELPGGIGKTNLRNLIRGANKTVIGNEIDALTRSGQLLKVGNLLTLPHAVPEATE